MKTFESNKMDVFYNNINEIDPDLALHDEGYNDESVLCDPRNGEIVTKIELDYSERLKLVENPVSFKRVGNLPALSKNRRKKRLKNRKKSLKSHTNTESVLIQNERNETSGFNESLKNLVVSRPDNKSKLHRILMKFCGQTIKAEKKKMIRIGEQYYSIQSAIPIKSSNESILHAIGSIIYQSGFLTEYAPECIFSDKMKSSYNLIPIERLENINVHSFRDIEIDVVIPEETIHMLLSPASAHENWNVLFKVTNSCNKARKLVSFETPFPLRSESKFLCAQMFDKIVHFGMRCNNNSYLSLFDGKMNCRSLNNARQATNRDSIYHIQEHDKYMSQYLECLSNNFSTGCICREWAIRKKEHVEEKLGTNKINLATNTTAPCYFQKDGGFIFVNLSFKLEYKSEFGVESMTKSELIKEWLRQFFTSSGYTKRIRVDVKSLKVIAIQDLSLEDIEAELFRLHGIDPRELIGSLYSILTTIHHFPNGEYMINFCQKFSDKFIVYSKTSELLNGGIKLSEMFEHVETKANLLEAADYIPIDTKTSQQF